MGHGDFAPRNILVGPGGRVSVLDTLGRWRAPAFEDIGNFLLAFKAHRLQVYSQGLFLSASRIKQYENQFLRGYFGDDPIPLASIRLFECLAALEKWSSVVHGHGQSRGLRGLGKRCLSLAWARHLRRTMAQLIQEIRS
jgi:hypothetical protein